MLKCYKKIWLIIIKERNNNGSLFSIPIALGASDHGTGLCWTNSPFVSMINDWESLPRTKELSDSFVILGSGDLPVGKSSLGLSFRSKIV